MSPAFGIKSAMAATVCVIGEWALEIVRNCSVSKGFGDRIGLERQRFDPQSELDWPVRCSWKIAGVEIKLQVSHSKIDMPPNLPSICRQESFV